MTLKRDEVKKMKLGDTYAMLVEGQFMDFDFEEIVLTKTGTKYLYFKYRGEDNWFHKKGCNIKYNIKSSCAWVEGEDYKEECYLKDGQGNLKSGYKTCQQMKGKCFMSAVLIENSKVIGGDKTIFGMY